MKRSPPANRSKRADPADRPLRSLRTAEMPGRVLVIDDDAHVRRIVTRQLHRLGVTSVTSAEDGREAIDLIESSPEPFEIAICDLNMPQEDGLVFVRRLADFQVRPAIILLSGEDQALLDAGHRLAMGHGLRVLGVIAKPHTLDGLASVLARLHERGPIADAHPAMRRLSSLELKEALDRGHLEVWFQPQLDLASHRIVGLEALSRIRHAEYGLVLPESFIGLAEEQGLIDRLTTHVVTEALTWCARCHEHDYPLSVSVNVTRATLRAVSYPDVAAASCERQHLDPAHVVFELTESSLASNPLVLLDVTTRLRLKGFQLSIDDFGTGYSSLEQLRDLPFNEMKLDQRMIQGAGGDSRSQVILVNSLGLARQLHMHTVAEGVETQAQLQHLDSVGCDKAQGYAIAPAMPGDQLLPWLTRFSSDQGATVGT